MLESSLQRASSLESMYWDGKNSHEVATALSCGREPTVRNSPGLSSHEVATAIQTVAVATSWLRFHVLFVLGADAPS